MISKTNKINQLINFIEKIEPYPRKKIIIKIIIQ